MVRTGVPAWCSRFTERHRSALNLLALVLGYALYLVVGACVFSAVELPYERALRRELKEARDQFLRNNSCVSGARLEELLARALEASNYGVSVLGNDTDRNWDFVSSLFFTSTVLTTTGYGHTVPLSDGGKAFCIFYSLFGIPVTLLFLSAVVQRLVSALTRRPVSYLYRRWAVPRSALAAAHAAALALAVFLLFVVVPSWVFVTTETDWNFLEALYFCFISLTTIGLGDYVPGETHGQTHGRLYRLAVTVYLLLGLVCVLVVLETCCELPQIRRLRHRFYQENVRDLDSETATIITRDRLSDRLDDDAHVSDQVPVIPSVSEQAATLRRNKSVPYTAAAASSVNGKLR